MPMPVWSFLEALGPGAPRILPLCTNEGSGMGRSEADIRRLCPRGAGKGPLGKGQRRRARPAGDPGLARKKQAPLNAKGPPDIPGGLSFTLFVSR